MMDDFIVVEPLRRPMIYTIAGSLCWFFSVLIVVGLVINVPLLFGMGSEHGWADLWSTKGGRMIMIVLSGLIIVMPIFVVAGHSFLKGRGRRGLIFGSLAFGICCLMGFLTNVK